MCCGKTGFKMLGKHITVTHRMTISEYKLKFPNSDVITNETKSQMRNSNRLTGLKIGTLETRFGDEVAAEIKSKIGKNSGAARVGKTRPKQAETLKQVWNERREEWSARIQAHRTPEINARISSSMKRIIAERGGIHLQRGVRSKFEKAVAKLLTEHSIEFVEQFKISNSENTRFYDFYIPQLNLLIECDGEFWHSSPERIVIDEQKNKMAAEFGSRLLRLSDSSFDRNFANIEEILALLERTPDELNQINSLIIANRRIT